RRLLEAGGHVHGVADDRDVAVAPNGGGHHLATVDADGEGQVTTEVAHGQGGGDGPLGVVVVGDGHAEHGHEGVAQVLVDGAAVAEPARVVRSATPARRHQSVLHPSAAVTGG